MAATLARRALCPPQSVFAGAAVRSWNGNLPLFELRLFSSVERGPHDIDFLNGDKKPNESDIKVEGNLVEGGSFLSCISESLGTKKNFVGSSGKRKTKCRETQTNNNGDGSGKEKGLQPNNVTQESVDMGKNSKDMKSETALEVKPKRKGKRAVVRWLKSFRWKKKKEYERMTAEEKILYKLKKARNKEARLVEKLKKIDPPDTSETVHDPEILSPEEHFYFLKMGHKSRNYVPVGRRGVYQGVILNMHLHWKKHQTLKVIVKTFSPEEVKEIAAELARLSGGIVLDIYDEDTIIMYRGKNYVQPPTEIMSPKITLPRKKALDKSKYRDALHAVRKFIPKLEQDLEVLKEQLKREQESTGSNAIDDVAPECSNGEENPNRRKLAELLLFGEKEDRSSIPSEDSASTDPSRLSDSEDLSDMFETDSEGETEGKEPLYLNEVEKFPSQNHEEEPEDFEKYLRKISAASKNSNSIGKKMEMLELDEIDKMFLQAGSLLRKRR